MKNFIIIMFCCFLASVVFNSTPETFVAVIALIVWGIIGFIILLVVLSLLSGICKL